MNPFSLHNIDGHARPSSRSTTGVAALLAFGLVCGCFGKRYAGETEEVVEVPESYGKDAPTVDGEKLDRWCSDFGAKRLEKLVDRAFDENLDLRTSWMRLKQASAGARQAGAARWPTLTAKASLNRQPQPTLPATIEIDNTTLQTSLAASYEVDLWGKNANQHWAAQYDAQAARAQVEAMAMSLTSQIAETWLNLVHQRAKKKLVEEQLEVSEQFLESTAMRLGHGQASALDVNQQRQQVEQLRGQLAQVNARIETAEHQLAVLVGKPPQKTVAGKRAELPELPERPDAGVPADLLKRRPDLRAAMLQLKAADQRTAAAVKSQFPTIQLSSSLFYQAPNLDELFEDIFWQALVSAAQPLFDGGRRFSEVARAKATAKVELYEYGSAVLTALREVQDAMVLETKQKKLLESLRAQVESARQVFRLARQRYARGATSYLRVLTALQTLQNTQQQLLDARRQQFSYRLQLCRSLGGTWTRELEAPEGIGGDSDDGKGANGTNDGDGGGNGANGDNDGAGSEGGSAESKEDSS